MQHKINLNGKTVLFVGLAKEANRFKMFPDIGSQPYLSYFIGVDTYREYVDVGFELIGVYPELTEDMAKMVVEGGFCSTNGINLYQDYSKDDGTHSTALESFQSLMEREQLFTSNPYDDFECPNQWCENGYIDVGYGDKWRCNDCQENEDKSDEAQQRTFDKWAVLIQR